MATQRDTSVIIVGAGLGGLAAALFLAHRGVPVVLVERHAGSSLHPRAAGFTPRTVELLRTVGLDRHLPQIEPAGTSREAAAFAQGRPRRARVHSLAGAWFEEVAWGTELSSSPAGAGPELSPCNGAALSQDGLEPLLASRAAELGADIRMSTRLLRFEQTADGVRAHLRAQSGKEYSLTASYLIAADGNGSSIREALGIGRSGRGVMRTLRSVLFRAPLDEYLRKGIVQFKIEQPDFRAFLTTYHDGRWVLMSTDEEQPDEATQLSPQCRGKGRVQSAPSGHEVLGSIRKAIGRDDVPIELITTGRWELSALIADRFASGRVFLVGDAAHTLPPARGGYGANTGIADAHNLAWKLQAVLSGVSAPKLLESYDAERRPVAWQRHDQIFAREDYKAEANEAVEPAAIMDDDAMEFGQLYRSAAVLGAGADLPHARRPDQWAGQPGTRAPHLWVERAGARVSTLDLLHARWVLLTGDARWRAAAAAAQESTGIEVECIVVGSDVRVDHAAFNAAFGLGASGASLVRPDGYVAWRCAELPIAASEALTAALRQVAAARSGR